ncbi:RING-H2 finger protein ATL13 [Ricinus communis]|uniref:RING-type E3 ubiquitin transferase n=1 Tax=Ricinus communis TaxID=3988 RepID=B9T6X0_RICCO|nr:RING-H2 finger protein ATL13 [Ricinus communis]EEF28396.1 ring finger protein, putative [Ricinus communis]|eukprot:XP_002533989.1 RING-H2 finger protein ATL13 [Ricinus communis]
MDWVFLQSKENTYLSPSQQPYFLSQPPPQQQNNNLDGSSSDGFNLNSKISPSVLLIIIILAIIFFVSGLLHLLVRFLLRPPNRDPDDLDNVTALQGQLQQLFHLHDAGVDQSFIDTLPVFHYKAIIGLKNPFDCAVCLCEFEPEDKLRLLPKCSHAFHMECIDTWLLSHSTCPLCRGSLLPEFSSNSSCSPVVLVLESGSESSREIITDRDNIGRTSSVLTTNSYLGFHGDNELGSSRIEISLKSGEILGKNESFSPRVAVDSGAKVVPVKLGKFRNVDIGEGSSNSNVDERRCFSMGSFEYVMDDNTSLQVAIRTPMKKQSSKKPSIPLTPGHRPAMSECDCESRREFNGLFEGIRSMEANGNVSGVVTKSIGNSIGRSKRESFSISKIWLRGEKEKQKPPGDSSRRAFSFRFPVNKNVVPGDEDDNLKVKNGNGSGARRTNSEIGIGRWENRFSFDEENQICNAKTPSFARRTLLWLVGRQNKVVHSSFTPNV